MPLYLNCTSLEDWHPGQPAVIMRRVEVVDRRTFDGAPRVDVRILEGPETGRVVTGLSPGNLTEQEHA
jgi:ribosomal protein S28E/S33